MSESDLVKAEQLALFLAYNEKIDNLYSFRDSYYLNNAKKSSEDRSNDLSSKLTELLNEIDADKDKLDSKSSYLILSGKAYNVIPDFNQTACDSLKKATKLDPKSVEAWNLLGECYWKKRDFEMCRICFEQSLNVSRNKQGLRGMSMVVRQLIDKPLVPTDDKQQTSRYDHIKNSLEESIKFAKESLQLDVKDGMSWYILANCYVSKFFSPFGMQSASLLKQAVTAYNLALKDTKVASLQGDLYFNKSMISMYEENWLDALNCLKEALRLDPYWTEASDNLKGTIEYLSQLNEMISFKGKLKEKKFQSILETIKKSDLGPYLEYTKEKPDDASNVKPNELIEADLNQLQEGANKNKILIAKIVCGLPTKTADNIVCFTAVLSDSKGNCAALTIYNLAASSGVIIGNTVCIPEPWLQTQDFHFENADKKHQFSFKSIRVENPMVLVVNGKKWTKEKVSSAFFVPKVMSD